MTDDSKKSRVLTGTRVTVDAAYWQLLRCVLARRAIDGKDTRWIFLSRGSARPSMFLKKQQPCVSTD